MYFNCAGILWMMLILLTLPHLKCNTICPSSCQCNPNGAVMCVGKIITDIPTQMPLQIYLLQFDDTNITVINNQSLAGQVLLFRFSLTKSRLHTIHPKAFQFVQQLRSVKLSTNELATLPAQVFSPLVMLEQLHLDGNQLETISPDMLEGLDGLLDLDLNSNKLSNLSSDVFDGLTKLIFLNLGKNSIKKLPPTIFHSLTNLKQLIIYNNELETLEAGIFDELVKLEELKLHHNQITNLPPQVFWSLRNLKILTLSSNRLKAIPEKSFYNMPKLGKLTIYNNPLLYLPEQLMGDMPDITEFYLFATNLTTVPGNLFANLSGLQSLHFHLNEQLSELPPDLFCCHPNLQKLSLKLNNLVHLHPQLFSRLTTLVSLLLSNNKLQSLPENIFRSLRQLSSLDLMNNNLKTLQGDTFLSNTVLRSLTLSGNPWNCSCSIRGIAKWIRQHEQAVLDRDGVMCHSPMHQLSRTIGSLSDDEFNFCDAPKSRSYFPSQNNLHEPTTPSYTISTIGKTSALASTTPLTTTTTPSTSQGASQQVSIPAVTSTMKTPSNYHMSPVFFDTLVLQKGPKFVHHNLHKGWVYVWFLPSNTALAGFLMFSHILLVAAGLFIIVAAIYGMYCLNKTIDELNAKTCYRAW